MVVEWLCPGLRPTGTRRPRLLHCKVILLDEHEVIQDVNVSTRIFSFSFLNTDVSLMLEPWHMGILLQAHTAPGNSLKIDNPNSWVASDRPLGQKMEVNRFTELSPFCCFHCI